MLTDDESPVTNQDDTNDTSPDNVTVRLDKVEVVKKSDKKTDAEDPKPRIVLTFRSEKTGAKSSNMKIVSTEEKHEEISPRRSIRTRNTKKESDDDNISHVDSDDDEPIEIMTYKRSTRHRSKEFSDILANAIARKEKANNMSTPPQRLSRRIKPTPKILANEELRIGMASQNNARLGVSSEKSTDKGVRTRRSAESRNFEVLTEKTCSKRKIHEESATESSDRESDNSNKKLVHMGTLGLKVAKDEESSEAENRKTESSANEGGEDEEIDDDTEVISKLLQADEESASDEDFCPETSKRKRSRRNCSPAPLRRSSRKPNLCGLYNIDAYQFDDTMDSDFEPKRKTTRKHTDDPPSDEEIEAKIANEATGETDDMEAACPTEIVRIIGVCLCEEFSNVYAAPSELTEPVFCQAVEMVDGVRVGCSHGAARDADGALHALRRAGPRAPYFLACKLHSAQLTKHMCCPTCGLFCTQGIFYQCSKGHLFHLECGIAVGSKKIAGCPHCGMNSYGWQPLNQEYGRVMINMHCSNKRVFLPEQREQCTPAFLGFSSLDPALLDKEPTFPQDLLPLISDVKKIMESMNDTEERNDQYSTQDIHDDIMADKSIEEIFSKIVRCENLNEPVSSESEGFTLAHAAAARARLDVLVMLRARHACLDAADCEGITPFIKAILALYGREYSEKTELDGVEAETLDKKDEENNQKEEENNQKEEENNQKEEENNQKDEENNQMEEENNQMEVKNNQKEEENNQMEEENNQKEEENNQMEEENNQMEEENNQTEEENNQKEQDKSAPDSSKEEDRSDAKDENVPLEDASKPTDDDYWKVITYLIAAGCDLNKSGPQGMSALHVCAVYGVAAQVRALLDAGARTDARDDGGWTPLVRAAESQHPDTVRILLEAGADPAALDNYGCLPVHLCTYGGDARSLALILRAAPHVLDVPTVEADTALHIAAYQGHYACVIVLLAHGAKTDIENVNGELAVEVCSGPCYDAISMHMQMTVAVQEPMSRTRIISSDISNGREPFPVSVVNEVDDATLDDFTYVSQHVRTEHIAIDDSVETMQGCTCTDGDCGGECSCCVLSVRCWTRAGRLPSSFPHHDPPMLFECNHTCGCNMKRCTNRLVGRMEGAGSLNARVQVFRTARRGWGLRATEAVARGTLLALYRGELLTGDRADARTDDQYMFALDLKPDLLEQCGDKTALCVDASRYGSAARFMNHSCRPSTAPVRVFTNGRDLRLPHVAFFALADIAAGDELTFDYGDKFWSVKSKWMKCECESPDCRYPTKTTDEAES